MKILLVEDDPMIQRMYTVAVQHANIEMALATDGSVALTAAQQSQPDFILLDIMMPQLSGIEALKLLKADPTTQSIPVAMLSANDDPIMMQQCMELGAVRYFVKSSIEPTEVISLVTEVLSSSQA